jgi:outer membrane protein assembly factor BamB
MNFLRSILLGACLLGCGSVAASVMTDFNQEHMITTGYSVIIHSPYDSYDHITCYSEYGTFLWDVSLNTKVISMQLKDGVLFVFSGSRYLNKTYLSCIDSTTGIVIWER